MTGSGQGWACVVCHGVYAYGMAGVTHAELESAPASASGVPSLGEEQDDSAGGDREALEVARLVLREWKIVQFGHM